MFHPGNITIQPDGGSRTDIFKQLISETIDTKQKIQINFSTPLINSSQLQYILLILQYFLIKNYN